MASALDVDLDLVVRWRGGDLARLINARHAAMHERLATVFSELGDWVLEPEVSFSIFGERGVIDGLAWHVATRTVLVIELKTEIVDLNELMATMDVRLRLAPEIARKRGWPAQSVGAWVVVADGRTNRRAIARHRLTVRGKFPRDGHAMRSWLRAPIGPIRALGFLPIEQQAHTGAPVAGQRRVRPAQTRVPGA